VNRTVVLVSAAALGCSGSAFHLDRGNEGGAGGSSSLFTASSTSHTASSSGASGGAGAGASSTGGAGGGGGSVPKLVPACDAPVVAPSGGTCFQLSLDQQCNPVTNSDCADLSCDTPDSGETFQCYSSTTHRSLCQPCDENTFCVGGLACPAQQTGWPGGSQCARYCCDDGDCGSGKCIKDGIVALGGAIGLRLVPAP